MGKRIIIIRLANGDIIRIPIGFILDNSSHKWITDFLTDFFNSRPESVISFIGKYPSKFDENLWLLLQAIQGKPKRHEYANLFACIWRYYDNKGFITEAQNFWIRIHESVRKFEIKTNIRIHKGALFYYWAWSILRLDNIDSGFLLIHQAFHEDQITHRRRLPKTPAYKTATLDYNDEGQYHYPYILVLRDFLNEKITEYNKVFTRNFSISDFHLKYLGKPFDIDTIFAFTHTLARLNSLDNYPPYILENDFSAIFIGNMIFDLLLVLDSTIHFKMSPPPKKKKYWDFSDEAEFLITKSKININRNDNQKHLGHINNNYGVSQLIDDVFNHNINFSDGYKPKKLEELIYLAYKLRNFSAHNIKMIPNLWKRRLEIIQGLFDVLFFTVEELY